ncbi:MAG TPA: DUF3488 and transglutaminase-like domain-containing protein [Tepidisphaeraceae bacterium]|jgi:Ca2+/Na+ antiporter|nr:DUF3488 and transglutaminase-like domain-containing protein [Tepidisphaeraceae bacterium]
MYNLKQFRPTLYVLLFLGFTGFAVAAESAGIWLLSVGALVLNAWLIRTNRFAPLPRWLANLVTVLALLYVAEKVAEAPAAPILVIGEFLVLLQIVKIWEQRANRDYAQLLVLSLLLVVAAAISTASLIFGLMLIAYLFLSLYCCLLFHLKVEAEQVRDASLDRQPLNAATVYQDQRYLTRSMRRLTMLVSGVAITCAVVVFLFFPRGTGGNLIGPLQFKASQTLTGFSDQVSFEQVARITQNNDEVARVTVEHNGKQVDGNSLLLLRGITLDVYGGASPDSPSGAWRWSRSPRSDNGSVLLPSHQPFPLSGPPGNSDIWKQTIHLQPTGTKVLFAIAGAINITPSHEISIDFSPSDQVLQTHEPLFQALDYVVVSNGVLADGSFDRSVPDDRAHLQRLMDAVKHAVETQPENADATDDGLGDISQHRSVIDPKILAYALRPEVCGTDPTSGKSLAELRPRTRRPNALDEEIAANMAHHLQSTFTYTLDLTDAAHIIKGQDPLVAFLYDLKRGHCEYFAGAMALMCQSLGMDARVVLGFKCDDYNSLGHYYEVNQSHAHAWVEVRMPDGEWKTFDPTSSEDAHITTKPTMFSQIRHFFNFLEFKWAEHVVAYDNDTRTNLIEHVEGGMNNTAAKTSERFAAFRQWITDAGTVFSISTQILAGLVVLAILTGVCAVGYFLFERWRLRRRAARIGLEGISEAEQLRLARQLKFYADLMTALERRKITRPRHLTPMEFAETLTFLPSEIYQAVQDLTRRFYTVRFGRHDLPAEEHRRLSGVVADLDARLPIPS